MVKRVELLVSSTPDNPKFGWGDHVEVFENDKMIYGGHASSCPNPYQSTKDGLSARPWWMVYGWMADGEYEFECIEHYRFGKCLIINKGGKVPSRDNRRGRGYLEEVFFHEGARMSVNRKWRGSAGCATTPPEEWKSFIDCFKIGDKGKFIVRPLIEKGM